MLSAILLLAGQAPGAITTPLEAPFKLADDAIVVDVSLNGKLASLLFDTGFGGYFIVSDQVDIGPHSGKTTLRDFVGQFEAYTVNVKSIQVGQLRQSGRNVEAVQQPVGHMSQSYGTHTEGIMGLSVVKDYVFEINFEKKKFIFYPKSTDISKRKPDNVKTFLVKMEPRGMNAVVLPCELNGKPAHLTLDTGNAFYATTHKEVLERVGLWDPARKPQYLTQAMVASGAVDSFYAWIPDAKIFTIPVKNSIWDIIDLPSSSADSDGTIGFGFLSNFNIVIDYERRYVWFENFTGKLTAEPKAEPGFRVAQRASGGYVIYGVYKGGPADEKGLKEGDTLLAIDGKSLSTVKPGDIRGLLEGSPDQICKLVISRQGIIQRIEVPRKILANGSPK